MTIRIEQPRDFDLVGDPIQVAGVASGYEATVQYRVHEGHDEVTGFLTVGGGLGEHAQFQTQIDVSGAEFALDRLFVELYDLNHETGAEVDNAIVPVILGTKIVPGYHGYANTWSNPATRCGPSPRPTTATAPSTRGSSAPTPSRSATSTSSSPARCCESRSEASSPRPQAHRLPRGHVTPRTFDRSTTTKKKP